MARAPFQILVYPYRKFENGQIEYALMKRSDEGYWQAIAGGGEDDGRLRQRLGEATRGVGESADAFRHRSGRWTGERPHPARRKAVRGDPLHRHPRTGDEDFRRTGDQTRFRQRSRGRQSALIQGKFAPTNVGGYGAWSRARLAHASAGRRYAFRATMRPWMIFPASARLCRKRISPSSTPANATSKPMILSAS